MGKVFNITGGCYSELHYMVDLSQRLQKIKKMVDAGQYFTINRARQYGKTTILNAMEELLNPNYTVVSLDFQMISCADFETEQMFISAFSREVLDSTEDIPDSIKKQLSLLSSRETNASTLSVLFKILMAWCGQSQKKIVLMIDEFDSATNNQVFLDFLAQLRGYYLKRRKYSTFQSVILAGVFAPFDIADDFLVDMDFFTSDIFGMLKDYENDYHTGMDIYQMSELLFDYTSGYPFLVSKLCKLIDERVVGEEQFPDKESAWSKEGLLKAVRILLNESNTLFESLVYQLENYPELDKMLRELLFEGKDIPYVMGIRSVEIALMSGFVRVCNNSVRISNRIFETLLYNLFLASPDIQQNEMYDAAVKDKNLFIENGQLDMKRILERFVFHFDSLYGDQGEKFYEEDGRRYFMLFLKPIINGNGNCYVEAETRNRERTDLIVDYMGEQFIIETKIWYGQARHAQGEIQLLDYLDHYHLQKGYLLTFNFNKEKEIGVKEITLRDKVLIEAVV